MHLDSLPVLALAGGAGSGKTALAKAFAVTVPGTAVVHLDQHFHTDLDRAPTVPSFSECPGHVIDHSDPRSIDWAGVQHAIGAACDAKRVLVEGTFALEHPIRELARWAVYLHTPDDVRLARKILRKFEDGGDPRASLLGYLARGRAAHHQHVASKRSFADFELDGAQTIEHLVDQLSTAIRL